LVLSDYPADDELALMVIIPHTTAVRGNRWEFAMTKPFLKAGVFHLQQIQPVSLPKLERRLGTLSPDEFRALGRAIIGVLNLPAG
jgi:mRNA interferase MazF